MRQKNLVMAAAALIASVSGSSATTMTMTQTAKYGASPTNWSDDLTFAGFDSSLGTLQGVSILVVESTAGMLTNKNRSTSQAVVTSNLSNTWSATLPGVLDGLSYLTEDTVSSNDSITLAAGATGTAMQVSGSSQERAASQPGQTLTPYESAFDIEVTDNGAVVVVSANGNGGAVFSDTGKIDVQVVYTYAAIVTPGGGNLDIPEPATFALLGSGVLGIGVIGRSRRPGSSAVDRAKPG